MLHVSDSSHPLLTGNCLLDYSYEDILKTAALSMAERAILEYIFSLSGPNQEHSAFNAAIEQAMATIEALDVPTDIHAVLYYILLAWSGPRRAYAFLGDLLQEMYRSSLITSHPLVASLADLARETIIAPALQFDREPENNLKARPMDFGFCGWHLAFAGLGKSLLNDNDSSPWNAMESRLLALRYVNALCTGDSSDANALFNALSSNDMFDEGNTFHLEQLGPCLIALESTQAGITLPLERYHDVAMAASGGNKLGIFAADILDFVGFMTHDADTLQLILNRPHSDKLAYGSSNLISYNPIRAALILGDTDTAARILQERADRRIGCYLDNLFLMRLYMLDRDRALAADHFRRLMSQVQRYGSRGRVEWELRLSRELSPLDLSELALYQPSTSVQMPGMAENIPEAPNMLIGSSKAMQDVRQQIATYADNDVPVLIMGETGTGKDLAARALHRSSKRRDKPFVAVNCAAVNESLLEAELFGHVRGSYTGADSDRPGFAAVAEDGTLFLDEIGDTSPRFQSSLLRMLENREFRPIGSDSTQELHCRIIAATNVDLLQASQEGRFRRDLLYRLQQLVVTLPPLRMHIDDIAELTQHFLTEGADKRHRQCERDLLGFFASREWPGNVRQLRNEIEVLQIHFPRRILFTLDDYLSLPGRHGNSNDHALAQETDQPYDDDCDEIAEDSDKDISIGTNYWPSRKRQVVRKEETPSGPQPVIGLGNPAMVRKQAVVDCFSRHPRLTRKEIITLLGFSQVTATRYLKMLCEEGVIRKVMPNKAPASHYFVRADQTS